MPYFIFSSPKHAYSIGIKSSLKYLKLLFLVKNIKQIFQIQLISVAAN